MSVVEFTFASFAFLFKEAALLTHQTVWDGDEHLYLMEWSGDTDKIRSWLLLFNGEKKNSVHEWSVDMRAFIGDGVAMRAVFVSLGRLLTLQLHPPMNVLVSIDRSSTELLNQPTLVCTRTPLHPGVHLKELPIIKSTREFNFSQSNCQYELQTYCIIKNRGSNTKISNVKHQTLRYFL